MSQQMEHYGTTLQLMRLTYLLIMVRHLLDTKMHILVQILMVHNLVLLLLQLSQMVLH